MRSIDTSPISAKHFVCLEAPWPGLHGSHGLLSYCRKNKAVVVAIRGTMSLADLVTDAVVHPESLAEWLPAATRKVSHFSSTYMPFRLYI